LHHESLVLVHVHVHVLVHVPYPATRPATTRSIPARSL
jgi:hypothetical protein